MTPKNENIFKKPFWPIFPLIFLLTEGKKWNAISTGPPLIPESVRTSQRATEIESSWVLTVLCTLGISVSLYCGHSCLISHKWLLPNWVISYCLWSAQRQLKISDSQNVENRGMPNWAVSYPIHIKWYSKHTQHIGTFICMKTRNHRYT